MKGIQKKLTKGKQAILHSVFFIIMVVIFPVSCTEEQYEVPVGEEDWSFLVFGDLRQGFAIYDILVANMAKIEPTPVLALCGGDIMESPNNEVEWIEFWEHSKPIADKMPIHIARGNHEGNLEPHETAFRTQTKLKSTNFYYAFTEYNTRFIICDTEIKGANGGIVGEQLEWLVNELDMADRDDEIANIFLCFHRPLFPQGSHYGQNMINAYELHDVFIQYEKIRAIFLAHDHIFHRLQRDGVEYIISGGAGAYLHRNRTGDYHHYLKVSITNETNRINVKSIGIFNEVVEDFDL